MELSCSIIAYASTYACTLYSFRMYCIIVYFLELDRWIVSRLAVAVRTCESAWPLFDFPTITSAIYNFWLYELCDYYIEYAKPFVLTREVQGNSATKVFCLMICILYYLTFDILVLVRGYIRRYVSVLISIHVIKK